MKNFLFFLKQSFPVGNSGWWRKGDVDGLLSMSSDGLEQWDMIYGAWK